MDFGRGSSWNAVGAVKPECREYERYLKEF